MLNPLVESTQKSIYLIGMVSFFTWIKSSIRIATTVIGGFVHGSYLLFHRSKPGMLSIAVPLINGYKDRHE